MEAVRTGLAAGAGAGAAVGLLLAFRRQRHQEIATALGDYDATERRITELYTKAADQLGSDKAAVRLAGLYALERLADNHVSHRQSIVEVICAYLRMPYEMPGEEAEPQVAHAAREERQVRLAAQRILNQHLCLTAAAAAVELPLAVTSSKLRFWSGISIDLTDAALIDWNFHGCHVRRATFIRKRILGGAYFGDAVITEIAVFGGATFTGHAWFTDATLGGDAWFLETVFASDAIFRGATFGGRGDFTDAVFHDRVHLEGCRADDPARPHVWPPGWLIDSSTGCLIHAGESPAAPEVA